MFVVSQLRYAVSLMVTIAGFASLLHCSSGELYIGKQSLISADQVNSILSPDGQPPSLMDIPDQGLLAASWQTLIPIAEQEASSLLANYGNWQTAPSFPQNSFREMPGRDSVMLEVPNVPDAKDYRIVVLQPTLQVELASGGQQIRNGLIYCAGLRERNLPQVEPAEVMRTIDMLDVQANAIVVVEALSERCPYVGYGASKTIQLFADHPTLTPEERVLFGTTTEETIRSENNGTMVYYGSQAGSTLAAARSMGLGIVLARSVVRLASQGLDKMPLAYFDDFGQSGVPKLSKENVRFANRAASGTLYQDQRWSYYAYGHEGIDIMNVRGAQQVWLADGAQDVFGSFYRTPRRAVSLQDDSYLHITYRVASNATQRRYWWTFVCGPTNDDVAVDGQGWLTQPIVQTPFFYQDDGRNPSLANWNCLQIFPRDGRPFPLVSGQARPESDVRIIINQANAGDTDNVRNVSPDQYKSRDRLGRPTPSWYVQQTADGTLGKPVLDDVLDESARAMYDIYIRRDRIVMYVNGEQRLCNDFPEQRLTMKQAVLGIGQVLYHSAAERHEFSSPSDNRTGQRYYLEASPYSDVRLWDDVGYQENTQMPSNFNASACVAGSGQPAAF